MKQEKVNCPFCLFSSGFKPFMGKSQHCTDCNGTGFISNAKYRKALKVYGDLIK